MTKSAAIFLLLISGIKVYGSENFYVTGVTDVKPYELALEQARVNHYHRFMNQEPDKWPYKAFVKVEIDESLGSGETTYSDDQSIKSVVRGNQSVLLVDVIPHEVFHMVVHSFMKKVVLPRWWDEGIATCCESQTFQSEKYGLRFLNGKKAYPTTQLWMMSDYPADRDDMLTLYNQSHSQVDFLLSLKPAPVIINFMIDAGETSYTKALKKNYDFDSIADFETAWKAWIPTEAKLNDCTWDGTKWVCGGKSKGNTAGPQPIIVTPGTPFNPTPTVFPGPVVPPNPTPTTVEPTPTIGQITAAIKDGQDRLNTQLQNHQDDLKSVLGANSDKLTKIVSKVTAAIDKISVVVDSPVGHAVNDWVLPTVFSATGLTGLGGVLLVLNNFLKAKAKGKVTFPSIPKLNQPTGVIAGPTPGSIQFPGSPTVYYPGYASPGQPTVVPPARDTTEAVQTLQLAQLEGRNPILDAIVGRIAQDKLQNVIQGSDPKSAAIATNLLTDIINTVNAMTPLSGAN